VDAAQGGEVVGPRGARLWSTFGVGGVVEPDDVVDVAASGRAGAPREHARAAESR
jgi:hypothetical protein